MAYKIDISIIIRNHFNTLVNDNTGKPDFRDVFFFLILPIGLSAILIYKHTFIDEDFIGAMIGGLSIYVGLSLNLIVLLFEIVQKGNTTAFKKSFAKDFIANVCFSIILSILTITSSLFTLISKGYIWQMVTNGVCYFMLFQMFLLILMMMKRLYYQLMEQMA